ncbi:MAG: cell division protein FtsQ/DivIB [Candidatus Omnitrophota bacterium]
MSDIISAHARPGHWGSETEFLRRTNNQTINKEKRGRAIRLRGLHIVLIFIVLFSSALILYKATMALLSWEKLRITSFELINKPLYKSNELQATLDRFKVNILTLSFSEARRQLLAFPEIRDVSLTRKLPATLQIQFNLRKPVFQIANNNKYNIIDAEGVVLNTSKTFTKNLICIQDAAGVQLEDLVPYLQELDQLKTSIESVGYVEPYGIALKLKGRKELFYPGETDIAQKISYYFKLRSLPQLKDYDIKTVDLRFKGRFYFEYETETEVIN